MGARCVPDTTRPHKKRKNFRNENPRTPVRRFSNAAFPQSCGAGGGYTRGARKDWRGEGVVYMARPAKSVKVKTGAIAGDVEVLRDEIEEKLRGPVAEPVPPEHLTEDQREIFRYIVEQLRDSDILGRLDVYVLESTSVAIARVRQINGMINDDPSLLSDASLQSARAKYQSDMWRGASELCLSPQARAKIGSLAAQASKAREDPLLKVLSGDD